MDHQMGFLNKMQSLLAGAGDDLMNLRMSMTGSEDMGTKGHDEGNNRDKSGLIAESKDEMKGGVVFSDWDRVPPSGYWITHPYKKD